MNNPRHERVLLIIAAYVIGFITAFIAYELSNSNEFFSEENESETTAYAQASDQTLVFVDDTGLHVESPNFERLLTVDQSSPLMASVINKNATPGVYYDLIDAELSRDGHFVYFCEQLLESTDTCDPYVYSIQKNVLYPIQLQGNQYKPSIDDHVSSWSSDNLLMIDSYKSVSSDTPWILTSQ